MPPFKVIFNSPNWEVVNNDETDTIGIFTDQKKADKMLTDVLAYIASWGL